MTMQTKTIGRMPTDHGPYDPNLAYGKKFCTTLFGCMWESLHDNNNTAPAVWDGGDTITPNLVDWKKVSGDYNAWLMNRDKPAQSADYPFNGMGRVKLLKHVVDGHNLLYQDDFYKGEVGSRVPNTNTVFEVPYEFELAENITIPDNCVLEFKGGSIDGINNTYTITGQNTIIEYNCYGILKSVGIAGTFRNDSVVIDIFDDTDWAIKMAKSVYISKNIHMRAGINYTQNSTLTIDSKFTNGTINGHWVYINCTVSESINVSAGVQRVKLENIFIETTISENNSACIVMNGTTSNQIREFNLDNIYIKGFTNGIRLFTVCMSTFRRLYIDAKYCILYAGKSSNVNIADSVLYCIDNSDSVSSGVRCYNSEDSFPEGLTLSNIVFFGFAKPLYINDIFLLSVYSCLFDVRSVSEQETDVNKEIYIEKHNAIKDIIVSDCWLWNTSIYIYKANNVKFNGCIVRNLKNTFVTLRDTKETLFNSCLIESVDAENDLRPNAIRCFSFVHAASRNSIVSNCIIRGFDGITNSNPNGYNQINAQFIDITGDNNGNMNYLGGAKYVNCVNIDDTPNTDEVRMNNGVLQYWDGTAWQNVS